MTRRWAFRISWSLWGCCVASVAAGLLFYALNAASDTSAGSTPFGPTVAVVIPTFGAVIATRLPSNPMGWILLFPGLLGVEFFCAEYATYALQSEPGSLPGGIWAYWFTTWVWAPGIFALNLLLPLLFPQGRLPSRRWRPVAWLVALVYALALSFAFVPWREGGELPTGENPLGIGIVEGLVTPLEGIFGPAYMLAILLCLSAPLVRFWGARGEERQQLKWFVYFCVLLAAFLASEQLDLLPDLIAEIINVAMVVFGGGAIGLAILKHRLYDIDVVINKTLVYASLTVVLATTYLGGVVSLQYALQAFTGGDSQFAVVASTLVIAALFNPLRRAIQRFIDRRFYRQKYDAAKALEGFSTRLRDETDLDDLSRGLSGVVRDTVAPEHVSLWLRSPRSGREPGTGTR